MTEQQAINGLNLLFSEHELNLPCTDSLEILNITIKALEEIQQYHAIGTVEELEQGRKYMELAKKHGTVGRVIDACADYEEIGTVEECQGAREKQKAKKPTEKIENEIGYYHCANCDKTLRTTIHLRKPNYCLNCGQKLDWSEGE